MTQPVVFPWRKRPGRDTQRFMSPAVRNLSAELGVDPTSLLGRGTDGRVTRDDVLAAAAKPPALRDELVPFDNIRKRTAAGLLASKQTVAHAMTYVAADYSAIETVRREARLTGLAFVARAVIDALREFPLLNATTNDAKTSDGVTAITMHRSVHLGVAVDLDFKGLVVPVVHDADGLRLRALAAAIRDVATRARARKLTPDDLAGGTFTITNPGASGTWISYPIINRPQVGILATDGVSKQVVVDDHGGLLVAPIGHLCLSFDHRALDGAYAGAFVRRVQHIVETRDWLSEL